MMCSILEKERVARRKNMLMDVKPEVAAWIALNRYDKAMFGDDEQ